MAYEKKTWVNVPDPDNYEGDTPLSSLPRFDGANMNRIEEGIDDAHALFDDTDTLLNERGLKAYAFGVKNETMLDALRRGCGFYQIQYAEDTPSTSPAWINLFQSLRGVDADGRATGFQIASFDYHSNKPQIWFRTVIAHEASEWNEILHTGNSPTLVLDAITTLPISKGGTGATKDFSAADSLKVKSIGGGTEVAVNADLNSYTTVGNYICSQSSTAQGLTNCPISRAFVMTVGYAHGGSAYISQEITQFDTGVKYYRFYNATSKVWSDWQNTYGTANDPVVKGTYSGDGKESQFIDLGFTPSSVEVYLASGVQCSTVGNNNVPLHSGGLAISGYPCQVEVGSTLEPIVSIVSNGFKVFYKDFGQFVGAARSNTNGCIYYYIARR